MNLKKTLFLLVLCSTTTIAQDVKQKYENYISADSLKKNLTYIASDEMGGRDTGSEGQKKVANYIISIFKEYGLTPIVKKGNQPPSYLQNFNVYKTGWKDSYVIINNKKKIFFKDYYPVGLTNIPKETEIETVFVGYGIKTENRNDYKKLDVKNKAVLFIEGQPENFKSETTWTGNIGIKNKQNLALELGAKCLFEVSLADADKFNTQNAERKAVLSRFNRIALEKPENLASSASPTFVISKNMAAEMLGIKTITLDNYLKTNDNVKTKKHTNIKIKSERGYEITETANILGFLEGTDKKDEVLVVTAHYDHLGTNAKGEIFNGADDDGSGTCAVIELAKVFSEAKKQGNGPRRSLLFMLVTGEEKGLLGSQFFTDIEPVIPLADIVCDLNIDMIGRVDEKHQDNENFVYLIGSDKLSSELHEINETANKNGVNFELDYTYNNTNDPNRFYYRSDHYNFAKNKIPVIFYFSGVHEDYHQPTDDVEKIMFPKYSKIVKLIFNTAWEISNRETRIKVDSNKP